MTGKKIGNFLASKEIFVKHLGIGWNEWRHSWKSWNHEHEWDQTNPLDYITLSDQEIDSSKVDSCSVEGDFSC